MALANVVFNGLGHFVPPTHTLDFLWGTTPGGPYPNDVGAAIPGDNTPNQAFSFNAGGLPLGTTAYVVAVIKNAANVIIQQSSERIFTTPGAVLLTFIGNVFGFATATPGNGNINIGADLTKTLLVVRGLSSIGGFVFGAPTVGGAACNLLAKIPDGNALSAAIFICPTMLSGTVTVNVPYTGAGGGVVAADIYTIANNDSDLAFYSFTSNQVANPAGTINLAANGGLIIAGVNARTDASGNFTFNGVATKDEDVIHASFGHAAAGHSSNTATESLHAISAVTTTGSSRFVAVSFT